MMSFRGRRRGGRGRGSGRGNGQGVRSNGPVRFNNQSNQPMSDERRFFDKLTKSDDSTIESVYDAVRLMKAALTFAATEGGPALMYRLNEPCGSSALRKCLEYITDPPLFEDGFLPLLERLAQADLNKPVYEIPMNAIISKLYELPFFMPAITSLVPDWIQRGSNDRRTVLAWFVAKIALMDNNARTNSDILSVAKHLASVGCGDHLKTILGGNLTVVVTLSHIRDTQTETPGGRHNNDKVDFRSIGIVPTCQEFQSDADPFLPAPIQDEQTTEASLLDRHFRLLREDILASSKEEKDDPRKQQRDIFYGTRPVSVESGVAILKENGDRVVGETDPCIMFKFEMPRWFRVNTMKTDKEKVDYWEKNRRILPRDALVCLERKNEQDIWVPVRFGTIVRRETKDLLSKPPVIGIAFNEAKDWDDSLIELSDRSIPPTRLFIVSSDLFAYQPILRGLQTMTEIPFKHEIVNAKPSLPAEGPVITIPDELKTKVDALDPRQRAALDTALRNRVALIQGKLKACFFISNSCLVLLKELFLSHSLGPPGTGKTFIGVLLVEIFLKSTPEVILIVCYTNHALDDVLESLLDVGITGIVRLGGRSRSERLTKYNLRELGRSGKAPFSRDQNRRFAQLKDEIEEAKQVIERLQRVLSREIGEKWWGAVGAYLKDNDPDSYQQ